MALKPGDTLHIPDTGPPHDRGKPHLFVMLTNPCSNGKALLVPICRIRGPNFDNACKLAPGEHEFIKDDSYAAYYHINQFSVAVLEKQLSQGVIRANVAVDAKLLKRICDGVVRSGHCPPVEKKYYQEQLKAATPAPTEAPKPTAAAPQSPQPPKPNFYPKRGKNEGIV